MKKCIISFITLLLSNCIYAQKLYRGLTLIRVTDLKAHYYIGNQKIRYNWRISPEIKGDSIFIKSLSKKIALTFVTDLDSISFFSSTKRVAVILYKSKGFNLCVNSSSLVNN